MPISSGSSFGPFRVVSPLGAGGMGEVWRARDTRLDRDVALKLLPPDFAADADRVARFTREAKTLAALNHPGIAAIYGFDAFEGRHVLAMELAEGEGLDRRIARGAIPVEEALAIARQIAEALEAAHEKGIVHRDLKPANVKVTAGGKVKLLDFGLAKALEGGTAETGEADLTQSPTLTGRATQAGMILGTAAYMSPEQARGKAVDKRSDIWAFGVVLFEMLTGKRLFAGETVGDTLAAVLKTDPDWAALPAGTPAGVRQLVRRCLARDPRQRLHDVADARIVLDEPLPGEEAAAVSVVRGRPGWRTALPWTVAALALAAAVALGLRGGRPRPGASRPLTAFGVLVPDRQFLPRSQSPLVDLDGSGRTLLFVAEGENRASVFRRPFDRLAATRVEGTEGAQNPLLSPDGRWIAFFAGGMLRRVPAEGGAPVGVAEARAPRGASWAPDGSLVFSPLYDSGLFRVAATGGAPVPVTKLDTARGERSHRWPQVLPDGRTVLFTVGLVGSPGDYDGARVEAVRLDTGARRTLVEGARMARYSAAGYLVYQRRETLLAVRFDPVRLERLGEPFTVHEGVGGETSSGAGYFAVGGAGALAVVPETAIPSERVLALVDRAGRETELAAPAAAFNHPRFSPDGARLAFSIGTGAASTDDVYLFDLAAGRLQRLTFGQGHGAPLWTPDGQRIVFTRGRSRETGIYLKRADGVGDEMPLQKAPWINLADSWLPDGRRLAVTDAAGTLDVKLLDADGKGAITPLFASPTAAEYAAAFSPDGRHIAYTSSETGTDEVFVETFPPGGGKWQISASGGMTPVFSRDGRELFFVAGETLMAVDVDGRGVFRSGVPRPLFTGPYELTTPPQRNYDVGPDGRFVVVKRRFVSSAPLEIVLLEGWDAADPGRAPAR